MDKIDFSVILERIIKYLIEGVAVGLACFFSGKLSLEEIIFIAVTAAATFAILDMYTPQVSNAARLGAGFGIGSQFSGIKFVG